MMQRESAHDAKASRWLVMHKGVKHFYSASEQTESVVKHAQRGISSSCPKGI
eukprot:jgi/Botrbrau1/7020/Bobra.0165s0046.1